MLISVTLPSEGCERTQRHPPLETNATNVSLPFTSSQPLPRSPLSFHSSLPLLFYSLLVSSCSALFPCPPSQLLFPPIPFISSHGLFPLQTERQGDNKKYLVAWAISFKSGTLLNTEVKISVSRKHTHAITCNNATTCKNT